jgi:hypothetical protein
LLTLAVLAVCRLAPSWRAIVDAEPTIVTGPVPVTA